jgi:hypothetical protein
MISSSIRFSLVGRAGGLHHEHVAGTHVLVDLDGDFTVGEAAHLGIAQRDAQVLGDLGGQPGIGIAGENHEIGSGAACMRSQRVLTFVPVRRRTYLAGEKGFEPLHAGIKIRCLNQLGDSPTQVNSQKLPTDQSSLGAQPTRG